MEKVKKPSSLKRSFALAVAVTMLAVLGLSAATLYGCYRVQKYILPDSREMILAARTTAEDGTVIGYVEQRFTLDQPSLLVADFGSKGMTDYTIGEVKTAFSALSPGRQTVYRAMSVSMAALPFLYLVTGIGVCTWWFYKKKLAPPIQVLMEATENIRSEDLDFTVAAGRDDELGRLCAAFEEMRGALYDNNRRLWDLIEQRKNLQASVAHDLRNPIAILAGYVEYLRQGVSDGTLEPGELEHVLDNLAAASKRMERYTDCIRDRNKLEEMEISPADILLPELLQRAADSFTVMAAQRDIALEYVCAVPRRHVLLDEQIVFRILENIFSNALRFARQKITMACSLSGEVLTLRICDDGEGFSSQAMQKRDALFYTEDTTGEHLGLGLATSRLLCQKHGGNLELSNQAPGGACVTVRLTAPPVE